MNKAHFIKLLQKYLQGKATKEEEEFLLSYYELFNEEADVEEFWSEQQKEKIKGQIKDSIWKSIESADQPEQEEKVVVPFWINWMPAAALVLALCLTAVTFFFNKTQDPPTGIAQTVMEKENRLIHLSDGSFVILKSGSKLIYPASFTDSASREVQLEGQAYFDVKHDPSKPFIVHVGNIKTTVLGTSFNIKAWPAEGDISITVTKGKVKVEDQHKIFGTIVKDQQLTFLKDKADVIQSEVDSEAFSGWKDQELFLDDVTLLEVAELLENRFGVTIICSKEAPRHERFTLTILKGESLEQVLISICEFSNAVYSFNSEKDSVLISSKKEPLN